MVVVTKSIRHHFEHELLNLTKWISRLTKRKLQLQIISKWCAVYVLLHNYYWCILLSMCHHFYDDFPGELWWVSPLNLLPPICFRRKPLGISCTDSVDWILFMLPNVRCQKTEGYWPQPVPWLHSFFMDYRTAEWKALFLYVNSPMQMLLSFTHVSFQCFDAVGWVARRASGL